MAGIQSFPSLDDYAVGGVGVEEPITRQQEIKKRDQKRA